MINMIEHIGSQIQSKITSGELDQEKLVSQAKMMADTFGKDPNISKLQKSMMDNKNIDILINIITNSGYKIEYNMMKLLKKHDNNNNIFCFISK